jgi:ATP-dependent Lon protease
MGSTSGAIRRRDARVLDPEQHSTSETTIWISVRPLEGAVHLHREHAGHDPRPAPRPDGRDPALGYTHEEKLGIAKPTRAEAAEGAWLKRTLLAIPDRVLRLVIAEYTREAGVRNLERRSRLPQGGHPCRDRPQGEAQGRRGACGVARAAALLRRRAQADVRSERRNGLAYTTVGGDVLFIGSDRLPGKGSSRSRGSSAMMQESAQARCWCAAH